jgi:transcription antitermination factor NusG
MRRRELERKSELTLTSQKVAVDVDQPWWAIYTRHQHEKTVADMLSTKGFHVFLPLYDSIRRWKDRKILLSLPLFPSYVFVKGGSERKLQIVSTPGVHMMLYRGDKIATIPEEQIAVIRTMVEGRFQVEPHPFLQCGQRVRVLRGALEGVEGILTRKKNLFRLVLSVDMLAQSVAMEVNAADVEPVDDAGEKASVSSRVTNRLQPLAATMGRI